MLKKFKFVWGNWGAGGILAIFWPKKSSKKSEKILKNQEKYSMNNGENPSSNRWMDKKLWPKNCPKITFLTLGLYLGSFLAIIF